MICVDASCRKNPGPFQYRGIDIDTKEILFEFKYGHGTNNIGEFLAVVHALAYCKKNELTCDIYTDSQTALAWVRNGRCNTTLQPCQNKDLNEGIKEAIRRAEAFLKNDRPKNRVLKWDTRANGEIPADYGLK